MDVCMLFAFCKRGARETSFNACEGWIIMDYADKYIPNTVNQAVILLVSYLSSTDKKKISKLAERNLLHLNFSLGWFIKNEFKLITNDRLLESCGVVSAGDSVYADEASLIIIKGLWKRLQELQRPVVH